MKLNEEKDLSVKFPEEYHAENLAGKDAVFTVKVNEINIKLNIAAKIFAVCPELIFI